MYLLLLPNKSTDLVANILAYRHFPVWGVPREFYTDLGTEFTAKVTEKVLNSTGVLQKFAMRNAYHSNMVGVLS